MSRLFMEHLVRLRSIEESFKLKENSDSFERCLLLCREDIEAYPSYIAEYRSEIGPPDPIVYSFQRLAALYELAGNYQAAISVCESAYKNNVRDKSKGGWPAKIERLKKNLPK